MAAHTKESLLLVVEIVYTGFVRQFPGSALGRYDLCSIIR